MCGLVVLTVCPKFSLTVLNSDHLFPCPTEPTRVLLGNRIILVVVQRKWPWAGNLEPRFLVLALPLGKSPFLSLGLSLQGGLWPKLSAGLILSLTRGREVSSRMKVLMDLVRSWRGGKGPGRADEVLVSNLPTPQCHCHLLPASPLPASFLGSPGSLTRSPQSRPEPTLQQDDCQSQAPGQSQPPVGLRRGFAKAARAVTRL